MLYYLLYSLKDYFFAFNVFRYITFRSACAAVTALVLTIFLGPWMIRKLYGMKIGQTVRKEECLPLYALHHGKSGTPTMGGALILLAIVLSSLLWSDLANHWIWITLGSVVFLGLLGGWDDYLKLKHKSAKGYRARNKFLIEVAFAVLLWIFLLIKKNTGDFSFAIQFPLFKNLAFESGAVFFLIWIVSVFVGTSNAVNLTDGLDGLAAGCVTIAALTLSIFCYVVGNAKFALYLHCQHIVGSGELTIVCAAMVGAGLGFLWYNAYPAQVFMGDIGSLALGGGLGVISLILKQEITLLLIGGVFVMEALSVIMQVASFKLTGKRIFRVAPIHHHFEIKGWSETKVTIRFWILGVIFALLSLATLKVR